MERKLKVLIQYRMMKGKYPLSFEEEDDAIRYAMMLEDSGSPKMHVLEVEDEVMIKTCEVHDYNYAVITPDDIVVPPTIKHDYI